MGVGAVPFLLLLLQVEPQDPAPAPLPAGALARVNGEDVSLAAFHDWLAEVHGWRFVDDYLTLVVLRQEAARRGLSLAPEDLERAHEEHWSREVLLRYGGSEEDFLADLAAAGIDRAGYRRRQAAALETEELARRLVLDERSADDAELRRRFAEEFPDGERRHLRVAFFQKYRELKPTREPQTGLLAQMSELARERAAAFLAAVQAEPDSFAERAREDSDLLAVARHDSYVDDLRAAGGEVPRYHAGWFGGHLEAALADHVSGDWVGPVEAPSGWYVVQLVRREPVSYEAVQDELRQDHLRRPATPREMHVLKTRLREEARIERPDAAFRR